MPIFCQYDKMGKKGCMLCMTGCKIIFVTACYRMYMASLTAVSMVLLAKPSAMLYNHDKDGGSLSASVVPY